MLPKHFLPVFLFTIGLLACTQGGGAALDPLGGQAATGESTALDEISGTPETPGTVVALDPEKDYRYRYLLPKGGGPYLFSQCEKAGDCWFQWVECSEIPQLELVNNPENPTECTSEQFSNKWFDCTYLKDCNILALEQTDEGTCIDCYEIDPDDDPKVLVLSIEEEEETEEPPEQSPTPLPVQPLSSGIKTDWGQPQIKKPAALYFPKDSSGEDSESE